jgi:putative redox protein
MASNEETAAAEALPGEVVVAETGQGRFAQSVRVGPHTLAADEPAGFGGNDLGPGPYDLLLAGLGACTAMTLRMYADRKQIPLENVAVTLRHDKIHAEDCAECETKEGMIDRIEREIELAGPLDDASRQRLLEIADRCPVHRTLESEVHVVTRLLG